MEQRCEVAGERLGSRFGGAKTLYPAHDLSTIAFTPHMNFGSYFPENREIILLNYSTEIQFNSKLLKTPISAPAHVHKHERDSRPIIRIELALPKASIMLLLS